MQRRTESSSTTRRGWTRAGLLVVVAALLSAGCGGPWRLAPWHSYGLGSDGYGRYASLHGRTTQQLVDIHQMCGGNVGCTALVARDILVMPLDGFNTSTWLQAFTGPRQDKVRDYLNFFLYLKYVNGGHGEPNGCLMIRFIDDGYGGTQTLGWTLTTTVSHPNICGAGHGFLVNQGPAPQPDPPPPPPPSKGARIDTYLAPGGESPRPCIRFSSGGQSKYTCRQLSIFGYDVNGVTATRYVGPGDVTGGLNYVVTVASGHVYEGCVWNSGRAQWYCTDRASNISVQTFGTSTWGHLSGTAWQWATNQHSATSCLYGVYTQDPQGVAACSL